MRHVVAVLDPPVTVQTMAHPVRPGSSALLALQGGKGRRWLGLDSTVEWVVNRREGIEGGRAVWGAWEGCDGGAVGLAARCSEAKNEV